MKLNQPAADRFGQSANEVYECAKCRDAGGKMIPREMPAELYPKATKPVFQDFWQECECAERRRIKNLFAFSEITPEMQAMTFEKFKLTGRPNCVADAYETARDYLKVFDDRRKTRENSIFLGGEPGSGKTHLLMAIANALIGKGIPVLYFPFIEGLDELKSEIREKSGAYQQKLEQLQRVPVLFIDDLFKNKKPVKGSNYKGGEPSEYEIKFVFSVLNHRYLNHMPVLISSELTIQKVIFWDNAIGSRIFEMTAGYQVHLHGEADLNYRLPPGFVIEG